MRSLASRPLSSVTNVSVPSVLRLFLATLVLTHAVGTAGQERHAFEISSVRVNQSGDAAASLRPHPDGAVTITNHSLLELIEFTFDVRSDQIVGAPEWANSRRFDILAKGGPNAPGTDGRRESSSLVLKLRSLLEERFRLKTHVEMREQPVFELLVRRPDHLGPQLSNSVECEASPASGSDAKAPSGACGLLFGAAGLRGNGASISEIVKVLGFLARRPVIDRTGLTGSFDVHLTFRPEDFERLFGAGSAASDPNMPTLFTAVEEQLGLRLRAARGQVPTVVVDSVEMPEPN